MIGDIHVVASIDRNRAAEHGAVEPAIAAADATPLEDELALAVELLDSIVAAIGDV